MCLMLAPFQFNSKHRGPAVDPCDQFRYSLRMSALEPWFQEMEPTLVTAPELEGILVELASREPIFHRPEFGLTRTELERMTVEDFWEVGASGRRYSRKYVLDVLDHRLAAGHTEVWETRDFYCRKLADSVYLLTFTLLQNNERLTRRATIWENTADGWKIVYHQGTVVLEA